MRSIVTTLEEPMSYYNYKRRKPEIREAINYNIDVQKLRTRGVKGNKGHVKNKNGNRSFVRERVLRLATLDSLPESRNKYSGIGDTIKNAKSELFALRFTNDKYSKR